MLATLDRPTIGFSVCAETRGHAVSEIGYQNSFAGGSPFTITAQYPQPIIRFGIADRIELDLIPPNYSVVRAAGTPATNGFGDSGLGAKFEFLPSTRGGFAIDTLLTFPTGSGGFSNGGTSATLNLDASYSLGPIFGFATTVGFSSTAGANASGTTARYFTLLPSAVITAQLPGKAQLYAELAHNSHVAPGAASRTILNGGIQKQFGKSVELDLEFGQTLNNAGMPRYHYIGFGLGIER
jgi:hypothetical protein